MTQAFINGFMSKCAEAGIKKEAALGLLRGLAAKAFPSIGRNITRRGATIFAGGGGNRAGKQVLRAFNSASDSARSQLRNIVRRQNRELRDMARDARLVSRNAQPGSFTAQLFDERSQEAADAIKKVLANEIEFGPATRTRIAELADAWRKGRLPSYGVGRRPAIGSRWDDEAISLRKRTNKKLQDLARLRERNIRWGVRGNKGFDTAAENMFGTRNYYGYPQSPGFSTTVLGSDYNKGVLPHSI